MHIQYWKDMLAEAGFSDKDIPTKWDEYWDFWCTKVQNAYRQKSGKRGFGTGGSGYCILKETKHPKEAFEVVKALSGRAAKP